MQNRGDRKQSLRRAGIAVMLDPNSTREDMMKTPSPLSLALAALPLLLTSAPALAAEPACESYTPAVIGGPVPPVESDTVAVRWRAAIMWASRPKR